MKCVDVNVRGSDFAKGVTIDDKCCVVSVDTSRYPGLQSVRPGMTVMFIDGVRVLGHTVRAEQKLLAKTTENILLVFAPAARDEFDLDSDNDEAAAPAPFQPTSGLPSLPPELQKNSFARSSALVVQDAVRQCGPGRCIIFLNQGVNPALPVTLAAHLSNTEVMYIDTVLRMKTRQKMDDAGEVFTRSLRKGLWIYVEQATKSITFLRKLAECITAVRASGEMHSKARVFLLCEPHPHFPESLMAQCVTLRCAMQGNNLANVNLKQDMMKSCERVQMLLGEESACIAATPEQTSVQPEVRKVKKKVKISNEVNIVTLEKSMFMEMSAGAHPTAERDAAAGATESITRVSKYAFGSNEKFISLCKVSNRRYAAGTSSGYVILLDSEGLPLIHFRPHRACVWDVSFSSQFDFATACEEGTSIIFNYSLASQELVVTSVASFKSDVFAVAYVDPNDVSSAVFSGGLSATICALHSDRVNSSFLLAGASIQAMTSAESRRHVLVGCGNGTCHLIDAETMSFSDSTSTHTRKVPAVACNKNMGLTGGFDSMLRLWDIRAGFQLAHALDLPEVITAVSLSDKYMVACSGQNLFVWDVRKTSQPYAVKKNAWRDLTRGLIAEDDLLVTASVDGVVRFWEIQ